MFGGSEAEDESDVEVVGAEVAHPSVSERVQSEDDRLAEGHDARAASRVEAEEEESEVDIIKQFCGFLQG